jgi:hypothetical protein
VARHDLDAVVFPVDGGVGVRFRMWVRMVVRVRPIVPMRGVVILSHEPVLSW